MLRKKYQQLVDVGDYGERVYSPEFAGFVEGLDPLHGWQVCAFRPRRWIAFPCDRNSSHVQYGRMGCKLPYCPHCAEGYRREAVVRALEVDVSIHEALNRSIRFLRFTFTLHPHAQRRFRQSDVSWLRAASERVLRRYYERALPYLKGKKWELGIRRVVQMNHSSEPFRGQFYHVQGLLYDFVWLPELREVKGIPVFLICADCSKQHSKKCPHEEAWLRAEWKREQECRFGAFLGDSVVHTGYGQGEFALQQRLMYDFRLPIKDLADYFVDGFHVPKVFDMAWMRELLLSRGGGGKSVSQSGFLQGRNLSPSSAFMRFLGLALPAPSVRRKERHKKYCLVDGCGGEVHVDIGRGFLSDDEVRSQGGAVSVWKVLHDPVFRPDFKKWWRD